MDATCFRQTKILGDTLSVFELVSEPLKSRLNQDLNKKWGRKLHFTGYHGPQPVSIARKNLSQLSKFPYLVSEKLDGLRFMLYCTKFESKPMTMLIDRSFRVFILGMKVPPQFFSGTILDMEIVNNTQVYAFDLIEYSGKSYRHEFLDTRLQILQECMQKLQSMESHPTLKFQGKPFWKMDEFEMLVNRRGHTGTKEDGYIFTPIRKPVETGTQYSLYKWKDQLKNTVDFEIVSTTHPSIFQLAIEENPQRLKWIQKIFMDNFEVQDFVHKVPIYPHNNSGNGFDEIVPVDDPAHDKPPRVIVECKYSLETKQWIPIVHRSDKTRPNTLRTMEKTMENIRENIQLDEIIGRVINNTINNNKNKNNDQYSPFDKVSSEELAQENTFLDYQEPEYA